MSNLTQGNRQSPETFTGSLLDHQNIIQDFETGKEVVVRSSTIKHIQMIEMPQVERDLMNTRRAIDVQQNMTHYEEYRRNRKTGREAIAVDVALFEQMFFLEARKETLLKMIRRFEQEKANVSQEAHSAAGEIAVVLNASRVVGERVDGDLETSEGTEFDIPEAFLQDPTIMNILKEHGVLRGDKVILLNSNVTEKFNRFKEILNFVFDVERDPNTSEILDKEALKQNYIFLINEGSKWLGEDIREMLTYRLAEAIYNDVTRMGGVIEKRGTGEYVIVDWKTGQEIAGNTYNELLKDANTRNLIDVARVASLIDGNFVLNDHDLVGDAPLIRHLLEEHSIADKTGNRIQKAELLLLDKEHVLEQINQKLEKVQDYQNGNSAKATQELVFLKEYVTQGELDRQNYMRSILKEVNHYRDFTEDNALIGSYTETEIENMSEEDIVDIAANALKSNRPLIAVFGLLALFAKQQKLAFGAFTLAIFGGAIADGVKVGKRKAEKVIDDDMLDLVKVSDIRFSLDNESYRAGYLALSEVNNNFAEQQYDENNIQLPYLENRRLFEITEFITSNGIDVEIEDSARSTLDMLKTELGSLPHGFTDDELLTYIKLIQKSDIQDSADTTLLDYLHEGFDPANRSYESVNFIGVVNGLFDGEGSKVFNQELNTIFRDAYEGVGDDRGERKNILNQRDEVKRIMSSQKPIQARIDDIQSYLTDRGTMLEGGGTLSSKVHESLTAYKAYSEAEDAVDGYTGIWDENVDVISNKIADALGLVDSDRSEQWKTNLSVNIDQKISHLETIKSEIPAAYRLRPEFIALINEIDIVITKLADHNEALSQDLNIDRTSSMLPESIVISHFSDGANVARLDQRIEDDIEVLDNFMTSGNLTIESLENIKTEYARLDAYSAYLANQTANNSNDRVKTHQTSILTNIDTFTKSDGLKASIETKIRDSLTAKFAGYESMLDGLDSMDINNLDAGMQTIQEAEEIVKSQISDTEIFRNIDVYSNALDQIVNNLSSAGEQTKTLWNNIKVGFTTLSLLNGNLDNLNRLGVEFQELRDNGDINENLYEQAQQTIKSIREELEKVQGIDTNNRTIITQSEAIIGSEMSISGADITLESIRERTIERKNELKSSAETYINSIDVSTLDKREKRDSTLEKINKIKLWFSDDAVLMGEIKEVKTNINLIRPLDEFTNFIDGSDPSGITEDIAALDAQIERETDPTKKDVLVNTRNLLDDIATNRTDITLGELHQELRNVIPETEDENALWAYLWQHIENIKEITTN